jgi:hypothetical protein
MPYCENCGKEVSPASKFCRNCGAAQPISPGEVQVTPPPPPPQAQVAQEPQVTMPTQETHAETVVGAIPLRRPRSLGRSDSFAGVVTSQRMIIAQMTNEMLKDYAQQAREQAKAEGKGFWGQWSDQVKASFGYTRRYLAMEPSAILYETPGNFEISNGGVREIKVELKRVGQQDQDRREFEIKIESTSGEYEFRMDEDNDYVNLLKQVYEDRVKMPFGYFFHPVKFG